MLERGADVQSVETVAGGYGWSALNSAAAAGHKDVVALLVRKCANLEATNAHGHTPLHSAAARGHIHVVRFIAEIDENYWKGTDEYKHWKKGEGKEKSFEESGLWIATTQYLDAKSGGKKSRTAAELADAFDHDFVKEFLDQRHEELEIAEQRRGGTNKAPPAEQKGRGKT